MEKTIYFYTKDGKYQEASMEIIAKTAKGQVYMNTINFIEALEQIMLTQIIIMGGYPVTGFHEINLQQALRNFEYTKDNLAEQVANWLVEYGLYLVD